MPAPRRCTGSGVRTASWSSRPATAIGHLTSRLASHGAAFLLLAAPASAQAAHDRHIFFERSLTDTAYYFSDARAIIPSTLAAVRGKLPVQTAHVFTAPNALRLTWTSRPGGTWHAGVRRETWRNQPTEFTGDSLVFRGYAEAARVGADRATRHDIARRPDLRPAPSGYRVLRAVARRRRAPHPVCRRDRNHER